MDDRPVTAALTWGDIVPGDLLAWNRPTWDGVRSVGNYTLLLVCDVDVSVLGGENTATVFLTCVSTCPAGARSSRIDLLYEFSFYASEKIDTRKVGSFTVVSRGQENWARPTDTDGVRSGQRKGR